MKKYLTLMKFVCLASLLLSLGACGGKGGAKKTAAEGTTASSASSPAVASKRPELLHFSHKFLSQKFASNPTGLVTALNKGGRQELQNLWNESAKQLGLKDIPESSALNLSSRPLKNGGGAVLIELPAPLNEGEAYGVALVLDIHKVDNGGMTGEALYMVLERSQANNARLYLLESGQRKLKGGDISPDVEGLWDAVRHQVRQ